MKRTIPICLILALTITAPAVAQKPVAQKHKDCPGRPKKDCVLPGPRPVPVDYTDCGELVQKRSRLEREIEQLEIDLGNINWELESRAQRKVVEAEIFLGEMIAALITMPVGVIKKGADLAKWLAQQAATELFSDAVSDLLSSVPEGGYGNMSTEDLSRLAAALPVEMNLRSAELRAVIAAIKDCYRSKEEAEAQFEKDEAAWLEEVVDYDECMKAYHRALRRWQRKCKE